MLGIWHRGEWMKRELAQPFHSRVECGSPIQGWIFHSLIRGYFLGFLCINVLVYMWILWLMYLLYFCCYYVGYKHVL